MSFIQFWTYFIDSSAFLGRTHCIAVRALYEFCELGLSGNIKLPPNKVELDLIGRYPLPC